MPYPARKSLKTKRLLPANSRPLVPVLAGFFTIVHAGLAQDALRTAVAQDQAYETRTAPEFMPAAQQLHAGPVNFQVGATYELEWTDNVSLRPTDGDDDFIHRPSLNVQALWPITDTTRLTFGAGFGYEAYMDHSDLGGFTITPTSVFAWDIKVKDFVFSLSDNFSYSREVVSQATIGSGVAQFPRLENTAGLRVRWTPSRYVVEVGYSHYNFFSESGGTTNFDYLDRNSEQFFGRTGIRFAEATTAGVEVSASLTDYQSTVQRDNTSYSAGPFVAWQITEAIQLSARGGANFNSFDPNPTHPESENLSSYYFGFDAQQRLTDYVRHGLSVQRDIQQGFNAGSDYIEQLTASYFLSWNFYRTASLDTDFSYGKSNEFQSGTGTSYDLYGFGAGLTFEPLDHVRTSVRYHLTNRDSQLANSGYTQNTVTLDLTYQF